MDKLENYFVEAVNNYLEQLQKWGHCFESVNERFPNIEKLTTLIFILQFRNSTYNRRLNVHTLFIKIFGISFSANSLPYRIFLTFAQKLNIVFVRTIFSGELLIYNPVKVPMYFLFH